MKVPEHTLCAVQLFNLTRACILFVPISRLFVRSPTIHVGTEFYHLEAAYIS